MARVVAVAMAALLSACSSARLVRPPPTDCSPAVRGESINAVPASPPAPAQAAGLCAALAATPSGTVDAFDRFSPWIATALGGLLLEVRSGAPADALARELGLLEVKAVACEGGTQALWVPGTKDPEGLVGALAKRAAARRAPLELVRWAGFGASSSAARVHDTCRTREQCEVLVRALPRHEWCALVLLELRGGGAEDAWDRCAALPDEAFACLVPALVAKDGATRERCARAVLAGPQQPAPAEP